MTQSQFNDWINNNPDWLFLQNKQINESYLAEEGYLKDPEKQQRRLLELAIKVVLEDLQESIISGE